MQNAWPVRQHAQFSTPFTAIAPNFFRYFQAEYVNEYRTIQGMVQEEKLSGKQFTLTTRSKLTLAI